VVLAEVAGATPPASPPVITSVSVSRSIVPVSGGRVTVRVAARHATTCVLAPHLPFACRDGAVVTLGAHSGADPLVRTLYVLARDAAGRSSAWAHASVTQLTSAARLPAMRRLPAGSPPPVVRSRNWSGYVATGGPFRGIQGTFTVPNLARAPGATRTSEWVGIDGRHNGYLIQAGVEQDFDPSTGLVTHYAWWQTLPDHPLQVEIPVLVLPGDEITVAIGTTAAQGRWSIVVSDDTTGQTFTTRLPYAGPASSAEWIVEAPTTRGVQDTLGWYSPRVVFSSVGLAGPPARITRAVIRESGRVVSTASPLRNGSFVVGYRRT
jgi:hypothetical protein